MAYVHYGVDYGTSSCKVVIQDMDAPGGSTFHPLVDDRAGCRIPSRVTQRAGGIVLGGADHPPSSGPHYDAVKMRVAARHGAVFTHAAHDNDESLPEGWKDEELATATVAWLLSRARKQFRSRSGDTSPSWGMTLGIPTAFRFDDRLTKVFLDIARAAFAVAKSRDVAASIDTGGETHVAVQRALAVQQAAPLPDAETIGLWLRTEALASIWWVWNKPEFKRTQAPPHFLVDIGAGTTNVTGFLFRGLTGTQTGISVLGAASSNVGTIAVQNEAGSGATGIRAALNPRSRLHRSLVEPHRTAFTQVRRMTGGNGRPWEQWIGGAGVMLVGGGSVIAGGAMSEPFHANPYRASDPLRNLPLGSRPPTLRLSPGAKGSDVNLTVAYGLAEVGSSLPEEWLPDQIEPLERMERRRAVDLADFYAK